MWYWHQFNFKNKCIQSLMFIQCSGYFSQSLPCHAFSMMCPWIRPDPFILQSSDIHWIAWLTELRHIKIYSIKIEHRHKHNTTLACLISHQTITYIWFLFSSSNSISISILTSNYDLCAVCVCECLISFHFIFHSLSFTSQMIGATK